MLKAKNKNKSIKDNTITIDYNKFLNNLIWRADEAPTFEEFMDEESKYNKSWANKIQESEEQCFISYFYFE